MPLFEISGSTAAPVPQTNFALEKHLQTLVEANVQSIFNCRLVASEFSTGQQHAGRIDTLALSEEHYPVIIEYKKAPSSELITQSLYYLAWIQDHRGDFEIAAQKALGPGTKVDWSAVRVIAIAPGYRKYDLHAARVMGTSIELWSYRLFENGTIYFEEVLEAESPGAATPPASAPKSAAAGAPALEKHSFEMHLEGKSELVRTLAIQIDEFISSLDPAIERVPRQLYTAYRTSQNIVCMETKKSWINLYLKLDPKEDPGPPSISRDVSNTGHYGTGDLEITIEKPEHFEAAKPYIEKAHQRIGG